MGTKRFVADFGAPTNGTSSCDAAVTAWKAYAVANPGSTLVMEPHTYNLNTQNASNILHGLRDCVVDGTGATVNSLFIGTHGAFPNTFDTSARFQTSPVGATSVALITPADVGKFRVGQWVVVTGLSLQGGPDLGYPSNFQQVEYRQITGIVGAVVSLSGGLTYGYKSTWPLAGPAGSGTDQDHGGPATIFSMTDEWSTSFTFIGLTVTAEFDGGACFSGGQNIFLWRMKFLGIGPSISVCQTALVEDSAIGSGNEVDKLVDSIEYRNCTGRQVFVQSASARKMLINGCNLYGINGFAKQTTIKDATLDFVTTNCTGYGMAEHFEIINSKINTAAYSNRAFLASLYTFDNGTFKIRADNDEVNNVYSIAVPGFKYALGLHNGFITPDSGDPVTFAVTDLRTDGTFIYVDTDIGPTFPAVTFQGGHAPTEYFGFTALSATQDALSGPANVPATQIAPGSVSPPPPPPPPPPLEIPAISATPTSVAPGGAVTVTVADGPGNTGDWVGLFVAGQPNAGNERLWQYLSGTHTQPSPAKTAATIAFTAPNTPGNYEFRFESDDKYIVLATCSLVVAASAPPPMTSRDAFEIWVKDSGLFVGLPLTRKGDGYQRTTIDLCWKAWFAAVVWEQGG